MSTTTGGQPLEHALLETPPIHIPNGRGGAYKTELTLERSPERTVKILWWHEDDPRPEPHNHPWPFSSEILSGGYTEKRWWLKDGVIQSSEKIYRQGDVNDVPAGVYHVVTDVQPSTTTRLTCGTASKNNEWGYLDLETLEEISARDPRFDNGDFLELLKSLNPHMRKSK